MTNAELLAAAHAALQFYRDESVALACNVAQQKVQPMMASVRVLSADAGNRAITVMAHIERARIDAAAQERFITANATFGKFGKGSP